MDYNDDLTGPLPAVLVARQWMGLGDYEKKRAEMLEKTQAVIPRQPIRRIVRQYGGRAGERGERPPGTVASVVASRRVARWVAIQRFCFAH
jgi:histone H3/H4